MHHPYIDKYGTLDSVIHKLDPRVKIISALILVVGIIFTKPASVMSFALFAVFICGVIALSEIPALFIFKRSLVVIPFVILISLFIPFIKEGEIAGAYSFGSLKLTVTYNGLMIFWNILIKSYLCVLVMTVFSSSMKYSTFLKALDKLKVPRLFIMVLSFMYRYLFVIEDELMEMRQAKDARTVGGGRLFHAKALANIIGSLFIRSYERSEAVYMAMRSRGFNGDIKTLDEFSVRIPDIVFMTFILCVVIGVRLIG